MNPQTKLEAEVLLIEGLIQLDRAVQVRDNVLRKRAEVFYGDRANHAERAFGVDVTPYNTARDKILSNNISSI